MILEAKNILFAYGSRPTLRNVSIALDAGELLALIGPNGSGKSTLIRLLLGVLHGEGAVKWEGRDLANWARRDLARRVAYLPQSPMFDPEHRVIDVLRLGRAPYLGAFGLESRRDIQVVHRVISMLDLNDLVDRRMDELSGGQRQRVFVGRCLVQEPAALLLDEPNTYLDLKHQVDLLALLRKLTRERHIAVLMASHDLNLAAAFADRLVLLQEGAVVASGTTAEVFRADLLSQVYGLPLERFDRGGGGPPIILPSF